MTEYEPLYQSNSDLSDSGAFVGFRSLKPEGYPTPKVVKSEFRLKKRQRGREKEEPFSTYDLPESLLRDVKDRIVEGMVPFRQTVADQTNQINSELINLKVKPKSRRPTKISFICIDFDRKSWWS